MAESSSSSQATASSEQQTIELHILSPSPEVPHSLTFPIVLTTTTVGELKIKIQDAVPTKPAPERQRLIYRGKALTQDSLPLKDIFTQEMVFLEHLSKVLADSLQLNSAQPLSLHLVLPPTEAAAQPHPVRANPALSQHTVPPRPASTGQLPTPQPGPLPNQQPHIHFGAGIHPQVFMPFPNMVPNMPLGGNAAFGNNLPGGAPIPQGLPPQLQQALNNHIAAMNQQFAQIAQTQGAQHATQPNLTQPSNPTQQPPNPRQVPGVTPHAFQLAMQQQQQARAAMGMQGIGGPRHPMPNGHQLNTNSSNTNTIVREERGPNGEHWRMVVETTGPIVNGNQATSTFPGQQPRAEMVVPNADRNPTDPGEAGVSQQTQADVTPGSGQSAASNSQNRGTAFSINVEPGAATNSTPGFQTSIHHQPYLTLQAHLSSLERIIASGIAPVEAQFQRARELLCQIPTSSMAGHSFATRLNNLTIQAEQIRASQRTFPNQVQPLMQPSSAQHLSTTSTVYVLSSPTGPQALLISPNGVYSSQPSLTTTASIATARHPEPSQTHPRPNPEQPPTQQGPAPDNGEQVQQNLQQQQANQAAANIMRLGSHLWLLIRLLGFVYFFAGGGGWRRTILMGVGALFVFIAQTGIFEPLVEAVWLPLRRHVEGLLPLAGNERRPGNLRQNENGTRDVRQGEPTPEQAAERILQQRNRGNEGFVRNNLRRFERAVALFVASLVPGVGERHIAAREAAEAVRQVEERERVERAAREEEEAMQRQEGAGGTERNGDGELESPEPAGDREQAAQQPLVEV